MQKNALKIAKDAAAEFKDLDLMVCGDVANTNVFDPNDKKILINNVKKCMKNKLLGQKKLELIL